MKNRKQIEKLKSNRQTYIDGLNSIENHPNEKLLKRIIAGQTQVIKELESNLKWPCKYIKQKGGVDE